MAESSAAGDILRAAMGAAMGAMHAANEQNHKLLATQQKAQVAQVLAAVGNDIGAMHAKNEESFEAVGTAIGSMMAANQQGFKRLLRAQ